MPAHNSPITFQDAVHRLERYWADQGCVVWMPHNVEVGAGTMNPATFMYVLGPEPWNVAYLEPGIRPDDARYGENPNRLGRHHQFQVILKPDPGDPQGLYLASLAALGIELGKHDVRFVEDNWESPALGAWGLGWEVWLDGLEISQFTYFQQAGSFDLNPNAIEMTYGMDRILMALQDVTHFKDLAWNEHVRFADVMLPNEVETSRYYFETADVGRLSQMYDLLEAEANAALDAGLVRPAHDYVLKCSHVFNVLDARGAVGVTERARFFGRMRKLARRVAEGYLKEREALGFPLLRDVDGRPWLAGQPAATASGQAVQVQAQVQARLQVPSHGQPQARDVQAQEVQGPDVQAQDTQAQDALAATLPPGRLVQNVLPTTPADFLLEVGVEELPVADLDAALAALAERMPALLDDLRLDHGPVAVLGTPRRLAVVVAGLAARQTDTENQVVGPPVSAAYDAAGQPTKAAEGFAKNAGVGAADLTVVERGGERRVAAVKREVGRPAGEVLPEVLAALVRGLPNARSMRWNASQESFSRPVRWLVALHGSAEIPVAFAGLTAGRTTRGLRPQGSPELALAAAGDYRKLMKSCGVLVDPAERRADVLRQVTALAGQAGGCIAEDPGLLDEVTNLVEQPHAILADFEPEFLALPAAVLITVMKKHQRYFPVFDSEGRLLAHFITVANGAGTDAAVVRHRNEGVIRARFADAAYFWKLDVAKPLAEFTPALAGLTFQAQLGSMLDKVQRLERLVPLVAARLQLKGDEADAAARAAALAKSDLATSMVVDFTSLQGTMGREYARLSGEPAAVADALEEQYRPRGAGDDLPQTGPGIALALADRLDSLVGLFAAGVRPKGTNDPFALRRAALGITSILAGRNLSFDLAGAIDETAAGLPVTLTGVESAVSTPEDSPAVSLPGAALPVVLASAVKSDLLEFIARRLEGQLREAGHSADAVAAVLAIQATNPAAAAKAVEVLERAVADPQWSATLTAYARCARIVRGRGDVDDAVAAFDAARLSEPAEEQLQRAFVDATRGLDRADMGAVLEALKRLAPEINAFFDAVLVMAEDPAVRANRLAQVAQVAGLARGVADLSLLEGF